MEFADVTGLVATDVAQRLTVGHRDHPLEATELVFNAMSALAWRPIPNHKGFGIGNPNMATPSNMKDRLASNRFESVSIKRGECGVIF